jgi:hypothetical protein
MYLFKANVTTWHEICYIYPAMKNIINIFSNLKRDFREIRRQLDMFLSVRRYITLTEARLPR